jgi:hypothetical protein
LLETQNNVLGNDDSLGIVIHSGASYSSGCASYIVPAGWLAGLPCGPINEWHVVHTGSLESLRKVVVVLIDLVGFQSRRVVAGRQDVRMGSFVSQRQ